MTFKNRQEHSTHLFSKLNILPLDSQIKLKQSTFMWNLTHDLLPPAIEEHFIINTTFKETRQNPEKFRLPTPRLEITKKNITYSGVKLWNTEIPHELKQKKFPKTFSKHYRLHLMNNLL